MEGSITTATARINPTQQNDDRGDGRKIAQAKAQAGQGPKSAQAYAFAAPSGSISVLANSSDYGLTAPASALGTFSLLYSIPGLPEGVAIPLTFNFQVSGSLKATQATSGSSFQYSATASGADGTERKNGIARIGNGPTYDRETSSGFIIGSVAVPQSSFSFSAPIEVESGGSGVVKGSLQGTAAAGGKFTIGNANFNLSLGEITVPSDFAEIDVAGLKVEFSSGITKDIKIDYGKQERFSEQQLQALDQLIDGLEIGGMVLSVSAVIVAAIPGGTALSAILGLGSAAFSGFAWYVKEVTEVTPEPDYSLIFTPQFLDFNQETLDDLSTTESFEDATDDLITALSRNLVLAEALDVTLDRAEGAEIANDSVWVEQQEILAGQYAQQLSAGIEVLTDTLLDFASQYRVSGLPQTTFGSDEIIEFQDSLIDEGIPETTEYYLQELGFEQSEINEIYNGMVTANPFLFGTEAFGLADLISSQEFLMRFENASLSLSQGLMT